MNTDKLIATLREAEGLRLKPYPDVNGCMTIGYGHRLYGSGRVISLEEAETYLMEDAVEALRGAQSLSFWPMIEEDDVRARVIVEMVFNMGRDGVHKFVRMAAAISRQDWGKAADEILSSRAAWQLKARYQRLSTMMRTGADL